MQLYLLLTEKCNLNCTMCIRGSKTSTELTLSALKSLPSIIEFAKHDIVITGGEPTLCKDFMPIVQYLSGLCNSVYICTNGIIDSFYTRKDFPNNVTVQVSLDGTRYVHDSIRGKGTYNKTLSTIHLLNDIGIPYTVATVVNRKNIDQMKSLADELSTLKRLKYWSLSYEMPFGYAMYDSLLSVDEWNHFVDKMLDYVHFRMKIKKLFPFELFEKNREQLDLILSSGVHCTNCGSAREKVYIYPDFTVYPCTCLTDFPLGNIKDSPLSSILSTCAASIFHSYQIEPESPCRSCEYIKYCNGGCIGMSYHYFGRLGMGDIRCPKLKGKL